MPQNAKFTSDIIQNGMLQAHILTVYSLIVDEAHDEGLTKQIRIYIRSLHGTEIKVRLLGFIVLDHAGRSCPS
ncbi:hypothetical protein PR048_002429 [Dryococelus australis]|uniref:Helicase ATP-binding domain-containing protein n=1 Tax=Dryococelus australis TaxID=614101 RepID=A0ABQ9IML8_9NEOP|nr:hypothetical protein PR048_002429 [Dryococelus australis]